MAPIPQNAVDDLFTGFTSLDNLFENMWHSSPFANKNVLQDPLSFAQYEDSEKCYIRAVVPGWNEKELCITIKGYTLTLNGKCEKTEDNKDLCTAFHSSFERIWYLGSDLIMDKCESELRNGILVVSIPKRASVNIEAKTIPIAAKSLKQE